MKIVPTWICAALLASACVQAPQPFGITPTAEQVEWQKMETNMFIHFGPNTFTGAEWGNGTEVEDIFNPTDLDCRQWVRTAKAAGFKGIVITAKHHDGFCLWPNPVSKHTVAQSCWKDGKGDVLKDLSEACAEYGLKFGVYISPWDRHDPHYGTPEYNDVYVQTLRSALTSYGHVYEEWFDGACGEGPNGKRQVYDWPLFYGTVRELQPWAVMFSDVGPGCRWVGNEKGFAGKTCWSTLDTTGCAPGHVDDLRILNEGVQGGNVWIPAETDVSIRKGWFWRESENDKVKSLQHLLRIWYESVGRNSLLLLNIPPDTRGHIHEIDSTRAVELRAAIDSITAIDLARGAEVKASATRGRRFAAAKMLDADYDTYWAAPDGVTEAEIELTLPEERTFNTIVLQEYIPLGQRVNAFTVEALAADGSWAKVAEETTIGYKRMLPVAGITTKALRIKLSALACPVINNISLYQDNVRDWVD